MPIFNWLSVFISMKLFLIVKPEDSLSAVSSDCIIDKAFTGLYNNGTLPAPNNLKILRRFIFGYLHISKDSLSLYILPFTYTGCAPGIVLQKYIFNFHLFIMYFDIK